MSFFLEQIRPLIISKDVTILIGNGYNWYVKSILKQKNKGGIANGAILPSWDDLVKNVDSQLNTELNVDSLMGGLSNPELFTAISLQYELIRSIKRHNILPIHDAVINVLANNEIVVTEIEHLAKVLKSWDVPVITTNYDKNIEKSLALTGYWLKTGVKKNMYYPISLYYRDRPFGEIEIEKSFAVWHCSGVVDIRESLRLDLSDYCNYTAWLKQRIPVNSELSDPPALFKQSWLSPFFKNKLIIIGLGLNQSEFFLRWLLVRRFAWRTAMGYRGNHGYYLSSNEEPFDCGKRQLLSSVGIETILYETWDQLYKDLFGL